MVRVRMVPTLTNLGKYGNGGGSNHWYYIAVSDEHSVKGPNCKWAAILQTSLWYFITCVPWYLIIRCSIPILRGPIAVIAGSRVGFVSFVGILFHFIGFVFFFSEFHLEYHFLVATIQVSSWTYPNSDWNLHAYGRNHRSHGHMKDLSTLHPQNESVLCLTRRFFFFGGT